MRRLVIDTDVGTDVDDLIALIYAIKNLDTKVEAITMVHGDAEIRAKIVRKLERILGVNIPITAGSNRPLKRNANYWCGFEHRALTHKEIEEPFSNNSLLVYDKDISLACIGPLTNIALSIEKNEGINKIEKVYFMGSHNGSHNFKADPEATEIVLSQPWQKFFVTKKVSEKISFSRKEFSDFNGNELGDFVYGSAIRWLDYSGKDRAYMYDVLAVSAAMGEKFVKFRSEDRRMLSYNVDFSIKKRIVEAIKNEI